MIALRWKKCVVFVVAVVVVVCVGVRVSFLFLGNIWLALYLFLLAFLISNTELDIHLCNTNVKWIVLFRILEKKNSVWFFLLVYWNSPDTLERKKSRFFFWQLFSKGYQFSNGAISRKCKVIQYSSVKATVKQLHIPAQPS